MKTGLGYYVIFKNLIFNGLLTADKNVPEKSKDGIFLYLQITQDKHNMYLQALKDKKEIFYKYCVAYEILILIFQMFCMV